MSRRSSITIVALSLAACLVAGWTPAAAQDLGDFERARLLRVQDLLRGAAADAPIASAKPATIAAGTGIIAGTVIGVDEEWRPSAFVAAWPADSLLGADGSLDNAAGGAGAVRVPVEPDGRYRLEVSAPGSYYVSATAKEHETAYFGGAGDLASAEIVEVPEDGTVEGIDIPLERLHVGEGSIVGIVVSAADGHPIANAVVHAFDPSSPHRYGVTETDADGRYVLQHLAGGSYLLEVWHADYMPAFYGDVTDVAEAARVEVIEPETTRDIDVALRAGGSISGIVQDGAGEPIAGAYVSAVAERLAETAGLDDAGVTDTPGRFGDPGDAIVGQGWAITGADGHYRMSGLRTGSYRIQAHAATRWTSVSGWYDGVRSYDEATPVAVAFDQETPGIDITLDLPVANSALAGRVVDAAGHPVAEAYVSLQDARLWSDGLGPDGDILEDGTVVDGDPAGDPIEPAVLLPRVWAHVPTDGDGRWVIDDLPAGAYVVAAAAENGWEHVQRWYVDAVSPAEATPVDIGEAERRADIDIVLPLRAAAASLTGVVVDQDGTPLAGAFVEIAPPQTDGTDDGAEPAPGEPRPVWAYAQTDEAGAYRVDRLPAGTYTVHATYRDGERYGHRWFDGADTPQTATHLILADGERRAGVDLQLSVRPIFGVVAGTLTDAGTGAPLTRAYVVLQPHHRGEELARGSRIAAPLLYWAPWAIADRTGSFRLEWIPEGRYSLTVYANGAIGTCNSADGDEVFAVRGGETVTCDLSLAMRDDGTGVIAGAVIESFEDVPLPVDPILSDPEPDADADGSDGDVAGSGIPNPTGERFASWSGVPEIAVVVAVPVDAPEAPGYTAVTDVDGAYELTGLRDGDYVLMAFGPGHIGTYYGGAYAPDRAETVTIADGQRVDGVDFRLSGLYRMLATDAARGEDTAVPAEPAAPGADGDTATGSISVFGDVADPSGIPVAQATVYLLDESEEPVAFTQTGVDGSYELLDVPAGRYRVYAGKLGFAGAYNGNERDFGAAESLALSGPTEVSLILGDAATAVEDEATDALPRAVALLPNVPNPFNPQTRIGFVLPETGRATLRIYNALGQQVAVLYDGVAEAGLTHQVRFEAADFGAGVYFSVLEVADQRLARPMLLVK